MRAHWLDWLGPLLVVVLFSLLPTMQNYGDRMWYGTIGPFDFYAYLIQHNSVLPLVLPLVAILPYALAFSGKLSHRYLTYTRTRAGIRHTLTDQLLRNSLATFVVFLLVGLLPQLFVVLGEPRYEPEAYGYTNPDSAIAAQLHWKTFSQLLVYGAWAPVAVYAVWLAVNAALYSTMAMCTVLLVPNRVLGFSLPWVGYLLTSFMTAILGLEAYSIALVFPFNLTQLPLTNLGYPLGGLGLIVAALVASVLIKAPALPQLQ
nr:hypothetical protein [Propionicimonas sp.]